MTITKPLAEKFWNLAGNGDMDRLEQIRLRRVYYSSVKHCLKSDTTEGGLNSDLSLTYKNDLKQ